MSPETAADALIETEIRAALASTDARPLMIGLCGAQGSGKSTAAEAVHARLNAADIACAVVSIDDFYLTAAERHALARTVHPLLRTRGVPGTHDVALAASVFDGLAAGRPVPLPRFDKARDDRAPETRWPVAPAGTQVVLFEGWCIGAVPQDEAALAEPVNALEAAEDPDGIWRRYVNAQLDGPYRPLFARLDRLILLRAPGFEVVRAWRGQQEADLRRKAGGHASIGMDDAALDRFIQHYERLTRHILAEMPARADLTIALDAARAVQAVGQRSAI